MLQYVNFMMVPQCVTEVRVSPYTTNKGLYVARQERRGKIVPSRCGGGNTIMWIPQVKTQVSSHCVAILYGPTCEMKYFVPSLCGMTKRWMYFTLFHCHDMFGLKGIVCNLWHVQSTDCCALSRTKSASVFLVVWQPQVWLWYLDLLYDNLIDTSLHPYNYP